MKKTLSILLFFGLLSCASKKDKIERSTDMAFLGEIIENYMLECTEANQLEVHTKAKFNPTDSTLTFYIGKSQSDFFQKWQIPLRGVNAHLIDDPLDSFHPKLKLSGIAQDSVITIQIEKTLFPNRPNHLISICTIGVATKNRSNL